MARLTGLLTFFALCHAAWCLPNIFKRYGIGTYTTFLIEGCSADQQNILGQAHRDALTLASHALQDSRELLVPYSNAPHKYINWNSKAAIDYFGPPDLNKPYREYIVNTFYRAILSYRGIGWSDWWNNRYVRVYCRDIENGCLGNTVAYNTGASIGKKSDYPQIVYCPLFFQGLIPHATLVESVKKDWNRRYNLKNLRSQATTVLHEWLHIRNYAAEVCVGGCDDTVQIIGGQRENTYRPGKAKLLARRDPSKAYRTNDNYAYFAMAKFMEYTFGTYPLYPLAWDPNKTPAQNTEREKQEPGYYANMEISAAREETDNAALGAATAVNNSVIAAAWYPEWYRPIANSIGLPKVSSASSQPWLIAENGYSPALNDVVCETGVSSPLITDCSAAFANFYTRSPSESVVHGKPRKTWWVGQSGSCAVEVLYGADWNDYCRANTEVIRDHASAVFRGCLKGDLGTVGGYVNVALPYCNLRVQILNTKGLSPGTGI